MARGPVLGLGPIGAVSADPPRDADELPHRARRQRLADPGEDPARRPTARDGPRDRPSRPGDGVRPAGLERSAATPRSALEAPAHLRDHPGAHHGRGPAPAARRRPRGPPLDRHHIGGVPRPAHRQPAGNAAAAPDHPSPRLHPPLDRLLRPDRPRSPRDHGSERDGVEPPRDDRDAGGARGPGLGEGRGQSPLRRGDRPLDVRARRAAPGAEAGALDGRRGRRLPGQHPGHRERPLRSHSGAGAAQRSRSAPSSAGTSA